MKVEKVSFSASLPVAVKVKRAKGFFNDGAMLEVIVGPQTALHLVRYFFLKDAAQFFELAVHTRITADHGNAETMLDTAANQPHTAHTLNLVPLLYIGRKAKAANGGALQDVAPTLLKMMGLPQPAEMTGKPLLEFL